MIKKILIAICVVVSLISQFVLAQSNGRPRPLNTLEETPEEMFEWLLSTGDWNSDPKLYIRTVGTGKDTIVVLHGGWGAEHRYLLESTLGLRDKYCFVFYDQRGSLRSPFPDSLITFANHVLDVERVRKELKLKKLKIAGHSMGAVLACAYLDQFPDRVKSLTLIAPAHLINPFPVQDLDMLKQSDEAMRIFSARSQVKQELNKLQLLRESPVLSSMEETYKARIQFASTYLFHIEQWHFMKGGGPFFRPQARMLTLKSSPASWDYVSNFRKSKVPVSIIVGDHDFLDMNGLIISKWTKGIANVKVIVLAEAAHEIWLDQPQKFRAHFDDALKK